MKLSVSNSFIYLLLVLLLSCSDDEIVVKEDQFIVPDKIETFSEKGGSQDINITCSSAWFAATDQEWCTVSPSKGEGDNSSTITVTTQPNTDYTERNATLTISSGSHVSKLTIVQKQTDALLLTSSKHETDAKGGNFSISIKSNVDYSYSIDKESSEWITAVDSRNLETSELLFKVLENENVTKREGHITFYSGEIKETFNVYQKGSNPELVLTQDNYTIPSKGEEIKIELRSNLPYSITLPDVEWLKENKSKAVSSYTHYYTVLPNNTYDNRKAVIKVKHLSSDLSKDITVFQLQKDALIVPDTVFHISRNGAKFLLPIATNLEFKVKTSENWIMQDTLHTRILDKFNLHFEVTPNPTSQKRSGYIILSTDSLSQKIIVEQEANVPFQVLSPLSIFTSKAGSQSIKISSLDTWTVKTNTDWCTVIPNHGNSGESILKVNVCPNCSVYQRSDSLIFTTGKVSTILPVVQMNMDSLLVQTPDIFTTGISDTIISVKLQSTQPVIYEIDSIAKTWISPLKTRSLDYSELKFKLLKNPNVLDRKGTITFTVGDKKQILNINQKGRGLLMTLSDKRFELSNHSHEIEFTITSNFPYRMWLNEVEWIKELKRDTLDCTNDSFYKIRHHLLIAKNEFLYDRGVIAKFLNTKYIYEFGEVDDYAITIIQHSNKVLKVSDISYDVPYVGSKIKVDVEANVSYSVVSDKWIKHQPHSRAALDTIPEYFIIDKNSSKIPRTGYITFFHSDSLFSKVRINQSANTDYDFDMHNELTAFESNGQSQILKFDISHEWTASIDQNWCKISSNRGKSGENQLTITTLPNTDKNERNAVVELKSGDYIKRLSVVQKGSESLLISSAKVEISKSGEYFVVTANKGGRFLKHEIDPQSLSWISYYHSASLTDSQKRFKVEENTTGRKRIGKIKITHIDEFDEVLVYQEANSSEIILTENSYRFDTKGGDIKIEVKNASSYKMVFPNEKWLQLKKFPSSNTYYVSILPNATYDNRNARILFNKANGGIESVNVFQEQVDYLEVDTISHVDTIKHVVAWDSIALRVDVTSNISYKVTTDQKWIKQRPQSRGLVTDSLYFDLDKNLDDTVRTAYITVAHDKKVVRRIKVVQNIKPKDPKPDPGTDPKPDSGTDSKPDPGTDPKPNPGTDPKPDQKMN